MKQVTRIHQIEITSRCNLTCRYCVHKKMPRPKMDMDGNTFNRALTLVQHFVRAGTQYELSVHGIGESTMHPNFIEYIRRARLLLPDIDLTCAINGVGLTAEMADVIAEARVRTWVSLHRPEKAGPAVELLRARGILAGVSADPAIAAIDWAGQVDWHNSAGSAPCMWQNEGMAIAWSDGRIGTCSLDGQGTDGVIGTVWNNPEALFVRPYSLCKTCHQTIQ